jgi:hypothetical protein
MPRGEHAFGKKSHGVFYGQKIRTGNFMQISLMIVSTKTLMKGILKIASKIIGIGFMLLGFLQWITFDYPDGNPLWPCSIFAPGMIFQFFNCIFVCIL